MLLMKVDIFLLLFVCGCVCASGEGGKGGGMGPGRFLMFFFLLYCSFFVWPGNAHVFSVVAFVRPNSDICEPEPPKDFCDVIPFVLLITTEIKE